MPIGIASNRSISPEFSPTGLGASTEASISFSSIKRPQGFIGLEGRAVSFLRTEDGVEVFVIDGGFQLPVVLVNQLLVHQDAPCTFSGPGVVALSLTASIRTHAEETKKNLAKNPRWLLKGSQDQSPQNDRFPSWLPIPPELRSARQCVPERCQCFGLVHEASSVNGDKVSMCFTGFIRVFMSLNSPFQSPALRFKFWRLHFI